MDYKRINVCDLLLKEYIRKIDVKNLRKALNGESSVDSFITKDGSTALHLASSLFDEADCLTVAEVLLSLGANPNIPNREGKTSLHIAASMGYSRLLDLLLVNGGDPILCDMKGESPVDSAHHYHHLQVVTQLNKFLNTENYGAAKEKALKYILYFLRQDVVELISASPTGDSESDTFFSCDSTYQHMEEHGYIPSSPGKVYSKAMNNRIFPNDESFFQESVITKCHKKSQLTERDKVSGIQHVKFNNNFNLPWMNNQTFLSRLKQEVEMHRTGSDSDSDNDLMSLCRCLGNKLKHSNVTNFNSSEEELESLNDSPNEFDIAHLNIDLTFDTVDVGDPYFNGTYMPLIKTDLFFSDGQTISNSLLDKTGETVIHNNEFDYISTNIVLQPTKNTFRDQDKISCKVTSNLLAKTQGDKMEFYKEKYSDVTAPIDSIKPETSTTVNLIKAPHKKTQYISRTNKHCLSCKQNFPKQFEEFNENRYSLDESAVAGKLVDVKLSPKHQAFVQITPQLSLKSSATKITESISSSCQSFVSVVEEFLYEDSEAGIKLIERRCPTPAFVSSICSGMSKPLTITSHTTTQKLPAMCALSDQSVDSVGTLTGSVKAMNADELRACLTKMGFVPGPIVPTTHKIYQRHLLRLRKNPHLVQKDKSKSIPKYSRELQAALDDPLSVNWESWSSLEKVMSAPFCQPDPTRHWRDGTNKTCFNYLLLDPRITQDLPFRAPVLDEVEKLRCFISAIFYIGKGSRCRPYYHLYEAIKKQNNGNKKCEKIKRIHDIWSDGVGVVSLHVFQNTIPVEAWTREAAMISAIGGRTATEAFRCYSPSLDEMILGLYGITSPYV
ncbi:uncharacterized protein [Procambarus clarkii]|uniref:uncharacterized protein isoform X2 n=1 Tax=Procambarus clarkii TaxID=6728 RepID=UPI00374261C2